MHAVRAVVVTVLVAGSISACRAELPDLRRGTAVAPLCPPREETGHYFPEGILRRDHRSEAAQEKGLADLLRFAGEPSLSCGGAVRSYRFIRFTSHGPGTIIVRVADGDEPMLHVQRLERVWVGLQGSLEVTGRMVEKLDGAVVRRIDRLMSDEGLFVRERMEPEQFVNDGEAWVFERQRDGVYEVADVPYPRKGAVVELARLFLDLAGAEP